MVRAASGGAWSAVLLRATLSHNWRPALYWSGGLALLGLYVVAVIPNAEALNNYVGLIASMPEPLLNAMGAGDTALLATPGGLHPVRFCDLGAADAGGLRPLLAGLNLSANEEEAGILDLLLSLPLARSPDIAGAFRGLRAADAADCAAESGLGLVLGSAGTEFALSSGALLATALNLVPGTLLVMAFTALAAAALRRHLYATGAGIFFVIGSYFLDFVAGAISEGAAEPAGAAVLLSLEQRRGRAGQLPAGGKPGAAAGRNGVVAGRRAVVFRAARYRALGCGATGADTMSGVIFLHTLRHTWLQMVYWGAGLGLMALSTAALVPFFDSMKMVELLQGLPPISAGGGRPGRRPAGAGDAGRHHHGRVLRQVRADIRRLPGGDGRCASARTMRTAA